MLLVLEKIYVVDVWYKLSEGRCDNQQMHVVFALVRLNEVHFLTVNIFLKAVHSCLG